MLLLLKLILKGDEPVCPAVEALKGTAQNEASMHVCALMAKLGLAGKGHRGRREGYMWSTMGSLGEGEADME